MRLQGKTAIVTGGGNGMGRAIALRLAQEGAAVSIFDIDTDAAEETVALGASADHHLAYIPCDVSQAEQVRTAVGAHLHAQSRLDILINNVGIMDARDDMVETCPDAAWDRTMAVNLKGPFYCCKYALPALIQSGSGAIVTSSSNAGLMGTARPAYGASKAAVIAMTLAVARQYASRGVRANVVTPGAFNTPMLATVRGYTLTAAHPSYRPLVRIAEPEEIAGAVAFLASDEAAYITGAIFPIDGGATAV